MLGQQGVDDRRDDGALVAQDAGEERFAGGQPGAQVVANLALDRARPVAAAPELADGTGSRRHQSCSSSQRSASIAALQPLPAAVTAWR